MKRWDRNNNNNRLVQSNLYKTDTLGVKKTVRLEQVSLFLYVLRSAERSLVLQALLLIYGTSDYYPSIVEAEEDVKNIRNSF